jgi:hypothetical protein
MLGLTHARLKLTELKMGFETNVSIDRFQGLTAFLAQARGDRPSLWTESWTESWAESWTGFQHHFQMEWIRLIVEYRIPQATTNKMIHTR